MSDNTKRWLISSGVTFLTGFLIALVPQLDSITLETIKTGAYVGILFAALRAGVKAVAEWFLASRV